MPNLESPVNRVNITSEQDGDGLNGFETSVKDQENNEENKSTVTTSQDYAKHNRPGDTAESGYLTFLKNVLGPETGPKRSTEDVRDLETQETPCQSEVRQVTMVPEIRGALGPGPPPRPPPGNPLMSPKRKPDTHPSEERSTPGGCNVHPTLKSLTRALKEQERRSVDSWFDNIRGLHWA